KATFANMVHGQRLQPPEYEGRAILRAFRDVCTASITRPVFVFQPETHYPHEIRDAAIRERPPGVSDMLNIGKVGVGNHLHKWPVIREGLLRNDNRSEER